MYSLVDKCRYKVLCLVPVYINLESKDIVQILTSNF